MAGRIFGFFSLAFARFFFQSPTTIFRTEREAAIMPGTKTESKSNTITLRGSAQIVSEFFGTLSFRIAPLFSC